MSLGQYPASSDHVLIMIVKGHRAAQAVGRGVCVCRPNLKNCTREARVQHSFFSKLFPFIFRRSRLHAGHLATPLATYRARPIMWNEIVTPVKFEPVQLQKRGWALFIHLSVKDPNDTSAQCL